MTKGHVLNRGPGRVDFLKLPYIRNNKWVPFCFRGPFWDKKGEDPLGAMQNLIDDQADEISELRDD
jgi:hypothetical protein